MLYFVGLGLKPRHLTLEAESALRDSSKIYVEAYTSLYSEGTLEDLKKKLNKDVEIEILYRNEVEQFTKIIEDAKTKNVSLAIFGNITSATTHSALIKDCVNNNIDYKLIPGISIFSVISMLTGLQEYRFGRTVSIVKPEENYSPTSFFKWIEENRNRDLHTICLLDIKIDKGKKYLMQPFEAANRLIEINPKCKDWNCIVVSGATAKDQIIVKSTLGRLQKFITDYEFPSTIVITGNLQMDEEEYLKSLESY